MTHLETNDQLPPRETVPQEVPLAGRSIPAQRYWAFGVLIEGILVG